MGLDKMPQNKSITKLSGTRKNQSFKRPKTSNGLGLGIGPLPLRN